MAGFPQGTALNNALFTGANAQNFGGQNPTGNFSPVLFANEALMFYKETSVVEAITTTQFMSGLLEQGHVIEIIKEPEVIVKTLKRGDNLVSEPLQDDIFKLTIEHANYFQFEVDDFERKLAKLDWESMTRQTAGYSLRNKMDIEVLKFMTQQCNDANIVGRTNAASLTHVTAREESNVVILGHGVGDMDPLNFLNALNLKLDEAKVPEEGRWVVVTPRFLELLKRTDSKFMDADFNANAADMKNGMVARNVHGFDIYKTTNCSKFIVDQDGLGAVADISDESDGTQIPIIKSGTSVSGDPVGDVIMAGTKAAVASVTKISLVEKLRSQQGFRDIIRGNHVYGRGVIRPEALAVGYCTYAS